MNDALYAFGNSTGEFSEGAAVTFVEQFKKLWPATDPEFLTERFILHLRVDLVQNGVELEYRHVRNFVVEALERAKEAGFMAYNKTYALHCARQAQIHGPGEQSLIELSCDGELQLVRGIVAKLKEVLTASRQYDVDMQDEAGDQWVDSTLDVVFRTFANVIDTDGQRAALAAACRVMAGQLQRKKLTSDLVLEDIIKVLEKLLVV